MGRGDAGDRSVAAAGGGRVRTGAAVLGEISPRPALPESTFARREWTRGDAPGPGRGKCAGAGFRADRAFSFDRGTWPVSKDRVVLSAILARGGIGYGGRVPEDQTFCA
jgi:hypothetical protein